jgi:hypothetical protein
MLKPSWNHDLKDSEEHLAYIAGLFDGEGCCSCKQRLTKRKDRKGAVYNQWYIRAEIAMTDEDVIDWVHQTLGFGWSGQKRFNNKPNFKPQWRWSCGFRDCLKFAKLIVPYSQVKKEILKKVIQHYEQ